MWPFLSSDIPRHHIFIDAVYMRIYYCKGANMYVYVHAGSKGEISLALCSAQCGPCFQGTTVCLWSFFSLPSFLTCSPICWGWDFMHLLNERTSEICSWFVWMQPHYSQTHICKLIGVCFFFSMKIYPSKFLLCLSLHFISLTLAKCYRHVGVRVDWKHVGFIWIFLLNRWKMSTWHRLLPVSWLSKKNKWRRSRKWYQEMK